MRAEAWRRGALSLALLCSLPGTAVAERLGRRGQIVDSPAGAAQTESHNVDLAETNEGGGVATSNFRQGFSVGAPISGGTLGSAKYRLSSGFGATSSVQFEHPLSNLDIAAVHAKASGFGADIPPKTWQPDADPVFIWGAPSGGLDLAGYSWAVDAEPDATVETTSTSVDIAATTLQRLSDGAHQFFVKAVGNGGAVGQTVSMEIWVDATPPSVVTYAPASETLLKAAPSIAATLHDEHSGVDKLTVQVLINGSGGDGTFDPATGILQATSSAWREGLNRLELRASDAAGNALTPLTWTMSLDTQPPVGTVVINGGAGMTASMYVTLTLTAQDAVTGVTRMLISNQRTTGFVEEPFTAQRTLWALNPVRGMQTVYVKFVDQAGNVSPAASDEIQLSLLSPDTVIMTGPAGLTPLAAAAFSFLCPEGGCAFSYAFDNAAWSDWSADGAAAAGELPPGNHYFRVKAAKEVNGIQGIQPDEEDPTPAERTWIIGPEPTIFVVPKGPLIKVWRFE